MRRGEKGGRKKEGERKKRGEKKTDSMENRTHCLTHDSSML